MKEESPMVSVPIRYTVALIAGVRWKSFKVMVGEVSGLRYKDQLFEGDGVLAKNVYFDIVKRLYESKLWKIIGSSDAGASVYTIVEWCGDIKSIYDFKN